MNLVAPVPGTILRRLAVVAIIGVAPAVVNAEEATVFSSGSERVALIELYTSEGCSSCPPADRWLSGLSADTGVWSTFVPVAFHVDYWDYIGWRDRFAERAYSDRQRRYISEGAADVVYTPGMFVAGREWLGWRQGDGPSAESATPGELAVRVQDEIVAIQYVPAETTDDGLRVNVAVLGMGLETAVARGENRGRRLQHDFVVLRHEVLPMSAAGAGYKAVTTLDTDALDAATYALAVWVSAGDSLTPLQATGGLLD